MKHALALCASLALILALMGCQTFSDDASELEDISWELMYLLPEEGTDTVAVYYFLEEGKVSPRSDYLIDALTTGLANAIREEGLDAKLVSRGALDRILEEQSFQLSGLADSRSQLALGKQLGADIIVTGSISPRDGYYEINAQLIRVENGIVLGGVIRSIYLE
jgi:TolB-like protein